MFNFGKDSKDIALVALIGLGLYAQCHNLDLSNNTTMLLVLFLLFLEHEEIVKLKEEVCCVEGATRTTACRCGNTRLAAHQHFTAHQNFAHFGHQGFGRHWHQPAYDGSHHGRCCNHGGLF